MKILQIAPLYESVPPKLYGGTERVVYTLSEELIKLGHEVTLVASGDSQTSACLIAPCERALRLDGSITDRLACHILGLSMAYDLADEFDLIHAHVDYFALPFARMALTPTVITLHGRLDMPELYPIYQFYYDDAYIVSISHNQRTYMSANWIGTVHHGIVLENIPVGNGGEYLAFLGRISREKRPDLAIEIAKRTGLPLRIAAKVDPADKKYYEEEIRPLMDHPLIEYVGEIGEAEKADFLGRAIALLFPIDWPEPFGLVMIEAMAAGTPVIARPCGSVPEIVADGKTGFLAAELDDLVAGVKKIDTIRRRDCRRHVEQHFSAQRMATDYEAIYLRAMEAAALKPKALGLTADFSCPQLKSAT
jgi:glycosyltransferase involved in cell wall biosynthesis